MDRRLENSMIAHNSKRAQGRVLIFRMTVSSYYYDEEKGQLFEYEMYVNIARRAQTVEDITRIRTALEEKGRIHFHRWLRSLNIRLDREIKVNFEREMRAQKQEEQEYARVVRFVMRRVDRRMEPVYIESDKMSFEGPSNDSG